MVYIPDTWFKNLKNQDAVFDLFDKYSDVTDIDQNETISQRLNELGETIILEHYENNEISLT
jgi:hypothetical protein